MKGHSERVPHKNIRSLYGKPACYWVLDALRQCKYVDEIIVNTDCEKIAETVMKEFSDIVNVLMRPDYLKGDAVSIQPLIAHDLANSDGEYYFQTHSTNPCVLPETYDKAVEAYFANLDKHDALFSVTPVQQRYYWPDGRAVNHDPKHLIQTQKLEPLYEENSCFYIFSKETNLKTENRLGSNPMMFPISEIEAADIDNVEDFLWAEFILRNKLNQKDVRDNLSFE